MLIATSHTTGIMATSRCQNPCRGYQYVGMHQPYQFSMGTHIRGPIVEFCCDRRYIGLSIGDEEANMRLLSWLHIICASYCVETTVLFLIVDQPRT
jgi:hypothetical protein